MEWGREIKQRKVGGTGALLTLGVDSSREEHGVGAHVGPPSS